MSATESDSLFQTFLGHLSQSARAKLCGLSWAADDDESTTAFDRLCGLLSDEAAEYFNRTSASSQTSCAAPVPRERRPRYCVVECAEGEWPVLRMFGDDAGRLAWHLASLEGKDVCVFPFYGVPIPLSRGPYRIMVLPDDTAWQLSPVVQPLKFIDGEIRLQEDGFLGPPCLATVSAPDQKEPEIKAAPDKRRRKPREDDDEDEDEAAV